jgi:hypothetical protein
VAIAVLLLPAPESLTNELDLLEEWLLLDVAPGVNPVSPLMLVPPKDDVALVVLLPAPPSTTNELELLEA